MMYPSKFKILSHEYSVEICDNLTDKNGVPIEGLTDFEGCKIKISRATLDRATDSYAEQIFMHELTHVVLFYTGKRTQGNELLSYDEAFVEVLSELLQQTLRSMQACDV